MNKKTLGLIIIGSVICFCGFNLGKSVMLLIRTGDFNYNYAVVFYLFLSAINVNSYLEWLKK